MSFDVSVLGAGPAGVALAVALKRFGFTVTVFDRARPYPAIEGLAERAEQGLRYLQLKNALSLTGGPAPRRAYWNGDAFEGNGDTLIDRAAFDRALLADAQAAGIELISARVEQRTFDGRVWRLRADGCAIESRWLIDARGRAAPADQAISGPPTTALVLAWGRDRSCGIGYAGHSVRSRLGLVRAA